MSETSRSDWPMTKTAVCQACQHAFVARRLYRGPLDPEYRYMETCDLCLKLQEAHEYMAHAASLLKECQELARGRKA